MSPSRVASSCSRMASAPWRDDAAGEQAHGLAGADAAVERVAGGGGADRRVSVALQRAVGGAQRVAVHGGDVGRRLGQARDHRGGGDAVPGLGQRDDLRRRRAEGGEDAGAGFFDADHARCVLVGNRGIIVDLVAWVGRRASCRRDRYMQSTPSCQDGWAGPVLRQPCVQCVLVGDRVDPEHMGDGLAGYGRVIGADLTDCHGDTVVPRQHRPIRHQCRGDQVDVLLDRGECPLV